MCVRLIASSFLVLFLQPLVTAQGSGPVTTATAVTPEDESEFVLQMRFQKASKTIEVLEATQRQFALDEGQINRWLIAQETRKAPNFKELYTTIRAKVQEMVGETYLASIAAKEIRKRLDEDIRTVETSARQIYFEGFDRYDDIENYIAQQSDESLSNAPVEFYMGVQQILDSTSDQDKLLGSQLADVLRNVSFGMLSEVFEEESEEADSKKLMTEELMPRLRTINAALVSENFPEIDLGKTSIQIRELMATTKKNISDSIAKEQDVFISTGQKLDSIKKRNEKRNESTFSSTNYMMLLLAFSFGITVLLRACLKDTPLITDQTLVEYGGMSFLILAVIILASGEKIQSDTVGPLLGTIAGYIFGRSIATRQAANIQSESAMAKKELPA